MFVKNIFLAMAFIIAAQTAQAIDIKDIPRLTSGLAPGTIAWATPDQLHPTQPQTGKREVERKTERFKGMLSAHGKKFSQKIFEFAYQRSVSPVYIAKTPTKDSRYGVEPVLGYITDRTHGSNAQSEMIKEVYGKKALSQAIYDNEGRPLNFILVKVMEDDTHMSEDEFNKFMVNEQHCYLKNWVRGKKGKTEIQDISFAQLPERVMDTTDNPYRGLIGDLQHQDRLGRSTTSFSQFIDAEALVQYDVITWDEVSQQASDKVYNKALKKSSAFFQSESAHGLPGTEAHSKKKSRVILSCESVFAD